MKEQKQKSEYYDGTRLLSMNDIHGKKPEIYICTSNRTGGKTTYWGRYLVNRFLKHHEKFMLCFRWKDELDDCAESFFKDLRSLFFPQQDMRAIKKAQGQYMSLEFCRDSSEALMPEANDGEDLRRWEECGYAVAINTADKLKRKSHYFSDVAAMLFDEFQSESNTYCPEEVRKFFSLHTTVARGRGEMVRRVPVIMVSNPVSKINPYYTVMGISARLRSNTKFLRGDGWVLEQGYIDAASRAQKQSAFWRAFHESDYAQYSADNTYLLDSDAFIETPSGYCEYLCTLQYKNKTYGVRVYPNIGLIFCDNRADDTFPRKIAVTIDDHNINLVMLERNSMLISSMRRYFEMGLFRFKDQLCKEALLTAISYH